MKVATHPGNFHADDVFAVAALGLAVGALEVVRTRDPALQASADVRIDVGGRADPATGDFDHHQKGGAGERENGVRYASFGLVWREYGAALAGDAASAARVDDSLVQGVDANDTGQAIIQPLIGDVRPMSVSAIVGRLNAAWDEELTREEEDARFAQAVALATDILQREIAEAAAVLRAQQRVAAAIARAADPRVIELDRNMPWRETVIRTAPEALFVIYPKADGWGLQAVPQRLSGFDNRRDLPAAWTGRAGTELAAVTGVPDAIFCHPAGFYASAGSREGVLALVAQALED
jgi:uncharacterized UPF0160 family protein